MLSYEPANVARHEPADAPALATRAHRLSAEHISGVRSFRKGGTTYKENAPCLLEARVVPDGQPGSPPAEYSLVSFSHPTRVLQTCFAVADSHALSYPKPVRCSIGHSAGLSVSGPLSNLPRYPARLGVLRHKFDDVLRCHC
jgi:hypothetical protein